MIDTKEIIFYILIFLIFYIFSKSSILISDNLKINQDIVILIFGIIFASICYLTKSLLYKIDTFHFEVTPQKLCDGGSYMYSSDPEKKKMCSQFSPEDLSKYECPGGLYNGRPVWFNRSNDTDSQWKNTMCNGNFNDYNDGPHVL